MLNYIKFFNKIVPNVRKNPLLGACEISKTLLNKIKIKIT